MATRKNKIGSESTESTPSYASEKVGRKFCDMPRMATRLLSPGLDPHRADFVAKLSNMWVNGTVIHYCFFEHTKHDSPERWTGRTADKRQVRKAFQQWKDLGVGLELMEVKKLDEAEIRIGFDQDDGSWSYLGTYPINRIGNSSRTMNFGWSLTTAHGKDTALHEIGHALGAVHEHQNPFSGIQWNRPAVYSYFGGPPNNWSSDKIDHNILNTLTEREVEGSVWDGDSIMHYEFRADFIEGPPPFDTRGIHPKDGLSAKDKAWVKRFYPPLSRRDYVELRPFKSEIIQLEAGEQINLLIKPDVTRKYTLQTFGEADTLMVLFEDDGSDDPIYLQADDDSGTDYNAKIVQRLMAGKTYILRIRLYYAQATGETAVMLW